MESVSTTKDQIMPNSYSGSNVQLFESLEQQNKPVFWDPNKWYVKRAEVCQEKVEGQVVDMP